MVRRNCFPATTMNEKGWPNTGGRNPPPAQRGYKNILVKTLHERCSAPLDVPSWEVVNTRWGLLLYVVQCLHKDLFTPTLRRGGREGPGRLWRIVRNTQGQGYIHELKAFPFKGPAHHFLICRT